MKKNVVVMAAALGLVAAVGLGSTFAYFTDKEEATNVVTMGHVNISLTEETKDEDAKKIDGGIEFDNLVPGDVVSKIVTITNVDEANNNDAFIRVSVEYASQQIEKAKLAGITLNVDATKWVKDGNYYYYATKSENTVVPTRLEVGKSVNLFETVTLPTAWTNADAADKSFEIVIVAEAVQADHFTYADWADLAVTDYEVVTPVESSENIPQ